MRRLLIAVLLVLCVGTEARTGGGVALPNGFVNGHVFMNMPTTDQSSYMMGVADGMMAGAAFGGNEELGRHIKQCLSVLGGDNQTLLTAVRVFMNTHLYEWSYGMHVTLYRIILQNCPLPDHPLK